MCRNVCLDTAILLNKEINQLDSAKAERFCSVLLRVFVCRSISKRVPSSDYVILKCALRIRSKRYMNLYILHTYANMVIHVYITYIRTYDHICIP